MSIWMFFKIFGDLCLYFSAVSALPTLFTHDFSFLLPGLLCGAGAMAASFLGYHLRHGHRLWALVIPLLALTMADEAIELLILLPPIVYTGAVIVRGDFFLDYINFRDFFRKTLTIWCCFFVLLILACTAENLTRPWDKSLAYDDPAFYGLVYALCGVILLRQLRLGEGAGRDRRINSIQTFALLGGTGALVLGIVAAQQALQKHAAQIMEVVGQVIIYIVTLPIGLLVWVIGLLLEDIDQMYQKQPDLDGTIATTENPAFGPGLVGTPVTQPSSQSSFPWWLAIVIVALLALMLMAAMRLYSRRIKVPGGQTVFEKLQRPERRAKENTASNRAKVRRCYREHLKLQRQKGLRLTTAQTSLDILRGITAGTDPHAAARLRDIYLKARYDEKSVVTSEDVAAAKDALKKLKE